MKILITSALPYANGPLHFGHIAGAYLPADCYARFERLQGRDVLFLCGSDEYGVAITLSAEVAGRTPQQHVDIYHEVIQKLFMQMNFSFDHYSRTTWSGHRATVQQFFLDLLHNGYIEEKETMQLYSSEEGRFLADRYVVGTCPKCGYHTARGDECPECGASYEATDLKAARSKLTNAPLTKKSTNHWFLRLDLFKERLSEWIESKEWKPNVINFIRGFIREMHPRAITRDSTWGVPIPLPNSEGKVLYVWFDAVIGYISAAIEWAERQGVPELWKKYWQDPETKLVHFIGKDNIPFHAAIFPAMIMGQNGPYKLVDELPANEFFKLEGRQFSKSDGWYIDLDDFFTRYTADQIRYAIAANAPENADSEFSWREFQLRCNSELLGKYGNLVNRVLVFAQNHCRGAIPSRATLEEQDRSFLATIEGIAAEAKECYRHFKVRRASQLVMELAQAGNSYFDSKQPWKDAKEEGAHPRMQVTIACCLECLKLLALISNPIIPTTSEAVWEMLGETKSIREMGWQAICSKELAEGQPLPPPKILFKRIEEDQIESELARLHSHAAAAKEKQLHPNSYAPLKEEIAIEQVDRLDLRVALIEGVERIPKSKKLLRLDLDIGLEKRTVVSGISLHYSPEQLIGKKVVLIANLKPAKLMGVESHGMILAGSIDTALQLVTVESLPPGAQVF